MNAPDHDGSTGDRPTGDGQPAGGQDPAAASPATSPPASPTTHDEELALSDDERLPWLESDDEPGQPGVDTGRIVAFAVVGLLAVLLVLFALWFVLRDGGGGADSADGSVIAAPETPYKTRPDDPGGAEVEGTGDTSFEVAEGERSEARLAEGDTPRPRIDRAQDAAAEEGAAEEGAAADDGNEPDAGDDSSDGVGVQIGAFSSRAAAERGWSQLRGRLSGLQGRNHRIVEGTADGSPIYRLQALAENAGAAASLCRGLKAEGGDCQVKR